MTKKSQHDAMVKLNQLSKQREEFEKREQRTKRFRNISIYSFLLSIVLLIATRLSLNPTIILTEKFNALIRSIPGKEYTFLVLGLISFIFLLVSVFKSISSELQAEQARKIEGQMAQKIFQLMLVKTNQ